MTRRDPAADGLFFYAVRTTGVYCRPSCAARLANRRNVLFFESCALAERAGFRPCKRCRPTEPEPAARRAAAVARACRMIEEAEEPPALALLARAAGLSPFHFHRVFKATTGVTPKAYADALRARRVQEGLGSAATVTEAIYDAGFNASSRFYATAQERLGMSPRAFRAGGMDKEIRFAVGQCWLGAILVAATDKGVCAIQLGDDPDALVRGLQEQFPRAKLVGGDAAFERLVAQVVGLVEKPDESEQNCRSTSGAPPSSSASGRRSAPSPPAPPRATPRSPGASARPKPSAPWPGRARRTGWPWRSRATAWCGMTGKCRAIAGGWRGSGRCWREGGGRCAGRRGC